MNDQSSAAGLETDDIGTAAALSRLNRTRIGGAGMVALGVASAATNAITKGRLDQGALLSTTSSAAAMIGMRMIPGVGWAATAYAVADMGSRAFLGKPFGETMVGKPIDWVAGKAGRAGMAAATGAMDLVGWKGGSDFLKDTIYPWAFPNDTTSPAEAGQSAAERAESRITEARASGLLPREPSTPILLRGPSQDISTPDTVVAQATLAMHELPMKAGRVDLNAIAAAGGVHSPPPSDNDVKGRRAELLASDHLAATQPPPSLGRETAMVDGRRQSNLADAISAEAAIKPSLGTSQVTSPIKPMGREYDD